MGHYKGGFTRLAPRQDFKSFGTEYRDISNSFAIPPSASLQSVIVTVKYIPQPYSTHQGPSNAQKGLVFLNPTCPHAQNTPKPLLGVRVLGLEGL